MLHHKKFQCVEKLFISKLERFKIVRKCPFMTEILELSRKLSINQNAVVSRRTLNEI